MVESLKVSFSEYIRSLQRRICDALESEDGVGRFRHDNWEREGGGGGHTRVIEGGEVFEKGGVNISTVHGELPEPIRRRFEVEEGWFWAGGLSLVLHPRSPMVPTAHANVRYFELYDDSNLSEMRDCWFGGGADLTPFYLWEEDAVHFHRAWKEACAPHGEEIYPAFKKECDDYFYNDHRGEARGVGGIFFDYLRPGSQPATGSGSEGETAGAGGVGRTARDWYDFTTDVGDAFLDSYLPIVRRRRGEPWEERHRRFQELRRGRYVEFNLIYDRGTLFGLKTGGRTESILMSLPPRVRWDYDFTPEPGSREEETVRLLSGQPVDWIGRESG
ncbi:MAG: oxygen-dependent coproporphyrinogen oxidase [Balneolaceae bacterium]|nr:oxygen-dependent coproporphyrinogen oxidase [Balneolaceae bacterium]